MVVSLVRLLLLLLLQLSAGALGPQEGSAARENRRAWVAAVGRERDAGQAKAERQGQAGVSEIHETSSMSLGHHLIHGASRHFDALHYGTTRSLLWANFAAL